MDEAKCPRREKARERYPLAPPDLQRRELLWGEYAVFLAKTDVTSKYWNLYRIVPNIDFHVGHETCERCTENNKVP